MGNTNEGGDNVTLNSNLFAVKIEFASLTLCKQASPAVKIEFASLTLVCCARFARGGGAKSRKAQKKSREEPQGSKEKPRRAARLKRKAAKSRKVQSSTAANFCFLISKFALTFTPKRLHVTCKLLTLERYLIS